MRLIAVTTALLALTAAQFPQRAPIEGHWRNPIGSAIIAIAPCGSALCGRVVWASTRGQREASTSTSHVVGTTVLTGMARAGDRYTEHIATPTGLDFARAAALYGLGHERVSDLAGFRAALERALAGHGSSIIEVPGDRAANRELHERVWDAVSAALSPPAAEAAPRA